MNKAKKKVSVRDLKPSQDAKGGRHGHGHHGHRASGGHQGQGGDSFNTTIGRGRHEIQ